jgi:replicative DNA helicase
MDLLDRPLPAQPGVEAAVLGAVLTWPETAGDTVAALGADGDVFTAAGYRALWAVVCRLVASGSAVSPALVLAAGADPSSIGAVVAAAGEPGALEDGCRVLREHWTARRTIALCYEASARLYASADGARAEAGALSTALAVLAQAGHQAEVRRLGDDMTETVAQFEAAAKGEDRDGYGTGLADLDRYFRLRPGELSIIAARPSLGKTALGLQIAVYLATSEAVPVAFFSLEMSRGLLRRRAVLQGAGFGMGEIRHASLSDTRWRDLGESAQLIAGLPVWCDDSSRHTVADIAASARNLARSQGIRLVIVDYLQLVRPTRPRANREAEVSEISAGCKALAKELDVPVLVLAQLNRQAEESPRVAHLRESGAIEQDADVIALLQATAKTDAAVSVTVHVAKHRNGPTGACYLTFLPASTRFELASTQEAEV